MVTKLLKDNKRLIANVICLIIILILFLVRKILRLVLNKILVIGALSIGLLLTIASIIIYFKTNEESKLKKYFKIVNEYYQIVLLVLVFVETIFGFIIFPATVSQTSMTPTYLDGDIVMVSPTTKVTNNDVIVFEYDNTIQKSIVDIENKELLIKRVIGLPGQKVEYRTDGLYIDNEKCEDEFFNSSIIGYNVYTFAKLNGLEKECISEDGSFIIPDGWYIVLGDNRNVSIDSRSFGLVNESQIYGVVKFRFNQIKIFKK